MATKYAGKVFGHLTVLDGWTERLPSGSYKQFFRVRCACGSEYSRNALSITGAPNKDSLMCKACRAEAYARESASGYKHPQHSMWQSMVARCHSPASQHYVYYGARGIAVCDAWRGSRSNGELASIDGFHQFLVDMGQPPEGTSIDRIDNDGPYSPDNCRWATPAEQASNRRITTHVTLRGKTLSITEWGAKLGHPDPAAWAVRAAAWQVPLERALELLVEHYPKPVGKWKKIYASAIPAALRDKPRPPRATKLPRVYDEPYITFPPKC